MTPPEGFDPITGAPEVTHRATRPDGSPCRAFELLVELSGADEASLVERLLELAGDIESGRLAVGWSVGARSSCFVAVNRRPNLTHEEWREELRAWMDKANIGHHRGPEVAP